MLENRSAKKSRLPLPTKDCPIKSEAVTSIFKKKQPLYQKTFLKHLRIVLYIYLHVFQTLQTFTLESYL